MQPVPGRKPFEGAGCRCISAVAALTALSSLPDDGQSSATATATGRKALTPRSATTVETAADSQKALASLAVVVRDILTPFG